MLYCSRGKATLKSSVGLQKIFVCVSFDKRVGHRDSRMLIRRPPPIIRFHFAVTAFYQDLGQFDSVNISGRMDLQRERCTFQIWNSAAITPDRSMETTAQCRCEPSARALHGGLAS